MRNDAMFENEVNAAWMELVDRNQKFYAAPRHQKINWLKAKKLNAIKRQQLPGYFKVYVQKWQDLSLVFSLVLDELKSGLYE